MNRFSFRKTALIALIILSLVLSGLFFCACKKKKVQNPELEPSVVLGLTLEGECYPGETLTPVLTLSMDGAAAKPYDGEYALEVTAEASVAYATEDKRVKIAESAAEGATFRVRVTAGGASAESTVTVLGTDVERVFLVCDVASAAAGDEISLRGVVEPEGSLKGTIRFVVKEGSATIEDGVLKIGLDADRAQDVVVVARAEGVESAEKRIKITTVQTTDLTVTLSKEYILPGGELTVNATASPADTSFPPEIVFSTASWLVWDAENATLKVDASAPAGSIILLSVRSGMQVREYKIPVQYPKVEAISCPRSVDGIVLGGTRSIPFTLTPADANPADVKISVLEGSDLLSSFVGGTITLKKTATVGEEMTFLLEAGDVYTTVTYRAVPVYTIHIYPKEGETSAYLQSGDSFELDHDSSLEGYGNTVTYRVTKGKDLVTVEGSVVTVNEGVGTGLVEIVGVSEDGVESEPLQFPVAGRYARIAENWKNIDFYATESESVWLVLPSTLDAGSITVIVPSTVTDLLIEGRYDGNEETAYKNLYFYFRNADRKVTFRNFGVIATDGLGGTVMDFGSSGKAEIILEGENLVKADTPYSLNNAGETMDGVWDTGETKAALVTLKRSGRDGYEGTAGGTAIAGYDLVFSGEGNLTAVAGNGVNGTAGGKGADAAYDEAVTEYVSGAGGAGGKGGDSGAAVYGHDIEFKSGTVTAIPGNAGVGGKGGAAGSLSALSGKSVTMAAGAAGADGANGNTYPAVRATKITGDRYVSSTGVVASLVNYYSGGRIALTEKLEKYYSLTVKTGTALNNPFANKKKLSEKYTMTVQKEEEELLRQTNFLMYTLSRMPKNSWLEVEYCGSAGKKLTIYLCEKITDGYGNNILGLTSSANNVWFATFDGDVRGVYYSGYYNIMIHEFVHVFHFNLTAAKRSELEGAVAKYNYGLKYTTATTTDRVYGVTATYNEINSCFLSSYSRKTVMEDVAETLSIPATFSSEEPPMKDGVTIRLKYDYLASFFGAEYETLNPSVPNSVFGYSHLFN